MFVCSRINSVVEITVCCFRIIVLCYGSTTIFSPLSIRFLSYVTRARDSQYIGNRRQQLMSGSKDPRYTLFSFFIILL